MTDPATTAHARISATAEPAIGTPERSRVELLRLLRNEACAPSRRLRPTPRFFPDQPPDAPRVLPDRLRSHEDWETSADTESRYRRAPAPRPQRRRKAHRRGRGLWLATAAMFAIAAMAGAGLAYIAATGRDLPGSAQLALVGETVTGLWPVIVGTSKEDLPGRVQSTSVQKSALMPTTDEPPAGNGAAVFIRGLEAMLNGDIVAARADFRRAVELGEQRAVAHLGRSYDPLVLDRLKPANATANREKAIAWYKRALEAGDTSVKPDMAALEAEQPTP